jgi:integrase
MASITREPNGRRTIQFVGGDGKRRSVRLGKVSQRTAEAIKVRIEHLAVAVQTGAPLEPETAQWLADRDDQLLEKLAAVGLIPRRHVATLAAFIDEYVASRTDVKPATKEIWRQGKMGLVEFFGADRTMRKITAGDCDNYKLNLSASGLAPMTVRKRLQFATTVFNAAVRHKMINASPFEGVSVKATMPDRMHFISPEDTAKLLEACPSLDWRLIVVLSRFGGLRCPSEVLSLRWQDIDWAAGRLLVTSPKTEHHPGKDTRIIPLFPELRPILAEAFEAAPEGAVYVVNEKYRKAAMGPSGWRGCNLRTTMQKIIRRAGLIPWPRLFHNLRSSCETQLTARFPQHVVAAWMGHSETVAVKHYLQVTDEHFQQAIKAVQNPVQQPSGDRGRCSQSPSESENARQGRQPVSPVLPTGCHHLPVNAVHTQLFVPYTHADGEGFEPTVDLRPQQFSRLPP